MNKAGEVTVLPREQIGSKTRSVKSPDQTSVERVALLLREESVISSAEVDRLHIAFDRLGIALQTFEKSEEVEDFDPNLLLSFSVQDAKLTKYPTYGILRESPNTLSREPRWTRNLLTYDAWLTAQPSVRRFVKDIRFGARKIAAPCGYFALSAPITALEWPRGEFSGIGCVVDRAYRRNADLIELLKRKGLLSSIDLRTSFPTLAARIGHENALREAYRECGIALILPDPENPEEPSSELFAAISACVPVIAPKNPTLQTSFEDSIWWYDPDRPPGILATVIERLVHHIVQSKQETTRRVLSAHNAFCRDFALEVLLQNLLDLHNYVLDAKGYIPSNEPAMESALPSVSYIIRTGNRDKKLLRRALDSLVAQQYPHLVVMLVLWSRMPQLQDIITEYPMLKFQVVEDFGGRRSTGFCTGMRALTTELFGVLDDDDELHPNHIRSMVKALRYHDGNDWRGPIGLAYSGSIEADANFPRAEKREWHDGTYRDRAEHRAIEHFRFFASSQMASHRLYVQSNAFLARTSLIDDEILDDPEMDTCEDLCLLLQFAQKTHFAFSGEVTAVHWYQQTSSSRVDAAQHEPDTRRISDRNHGRYFPADIKYVNDVSRYLDPNWPTGYLRGIAGVAQAVIGASVATEVTSAALHRPVGPATPPHAMRQPVPTLIGNLLPLMQAPGGKRTENGEVFIPREAPAGIALYGPYIRLSAGSYIVTIDLELEQIDRTTETIFEVDVVADAGMSVVRPPIAFRQDSLDFVDHSGRAVLSFNVESGLADREFEVRLHHRKVCALRVLAIRCEQSEPRPRVGSGTEAGSGPPDSRNETEQIPNGSGRFRRRIRKVLGIR